MATPSRKRKKSHFFTPKPKRNKSSWKGELCRGMKGILVSTSDHEGLCVPEAYNLLNEYADQLYGPETQTRESQTCGSGDISSSLEQEMSEIRGDEHRPRRFQAVNTGTKHLVFIECNPPVEPVALVHSMFSDILTSKKQKARFCQRFIPVSAVCHANKKDIEKCVSELFVPYFYQEKRPLKFAVAYKARNNQDIDREEIIRTLASLVTRDGDYPHRVDLCNPDLTVMVEIVKGNFCTSVVKDYNKFKRYNIQSLMGLLQGSTEGQDEAPKPSTESAQSKSKSETSEEIV